MREIDRFEVRADDGRTWQFAVMQKYRIWKPLSGPEQKVPSSTEYVSLDARGRYDIHPTGTDTFNLVDLQSDTADLEVYRVRVAPTAHS